MTYPILEGVPIIVKTLKTWWFSERGKLSIARCETPRMVEFFDMLGRDNPDRRAERCLLSTYMESHYGAGDEVSSVSIPFSIPSLFWEMVVELMPADEKYKHALDMGCSVGRYTFELARFSELSVGIDLNFDVVSAAAKIQRMQTVCYERRKRGNCFETVKVPYSAPQNVLFLVADALDPPFLAESFDLVAGLNLLDNVRLPLVLIGQMDALLRRGGELILSSPYEWRADICEPVEWLENETMAAPIMVRKILEGNLFPQMGFKYQVLQESSEVPWALRHHERYWTLFLVHLIKARKG